MDQRIRSNQQLWEQWTESHVGSRYYDVDGFRAGKSSLLPLELAEAGDVEGKTMLHLQCHFGLDSLSWARRGAVVTGVDFSANAIATAQTLAAECGIPARFVLSDVYALPERLDGTFDIVFTSYGVLPWLPDLTRWAQVVAHFLRPGGTFYVADLHPAGRTVDKSWPPAIARPYFQDGPVEREPVSYTDATSEPLDHTAYLWPHSLGTIVTSLLDAGLALEYLHEWPFNCFQRNEHMTQGEDGFWRYPEDRVPLTFSIRAHKPAASP